MQLQLKTIVLEVQLSWSHPQMRDEGCPAAKCWCVHMQRKQMQDVAGDHHSLTASVPCTLQGPHPTGAGPNVPPGHAMVQQ
jgi:hypothetical protein